jgi:hypothetical protein
MAKKKHPIFRLHKIKVHPNRWLIWAIAYVLFVTIAMVGYIKITDEAVVTPQPEQVFISWHTYSNPTLGFALRYPANWSVESSQVGSVSFGPADSSKSGIEVDVYKPNAEKIARNSLKIVDQTPITVDGVAAVEITNNLGKNQTETVVLVNNKVHVYLIRGSKADVEKVLLTFSFINNLK